VVSMWVAGISQGLMWRAVDAEGRLIYPDFIDTVTRIVPLYSVRVVGGLLYLGGFILMLVNVYLTIRKAPARIEDEAFAAPVLTPSTEANLGKQFHRKLEGLPTVFSVLTFLAVIVGTVIELVPTFVSDDLVTVHPQLKPYTGLQLHGRDLYVREGCYLCHSQMIRPIPSETLRYGAYSRAEESIFDHPFQWGSKRIGPDLARIGSKYPDLWHYRHMMDPREVSPGSIMPAYPWLYRDRTDFALIAKKIRVMKSMGVPYSETDLRQAEGDARDEAMQIVLGLEKEGVSGLKAEHSASARALPVSHVDVPRPFAVCWSLCRGFSLDIPRRSPFLG
jgi:cytochrome c oxidase cbb3-type subunit I/II